MKEIVAAKARERESFGGQGVEILPHLQGKTRDELGALAGVSGKTIDLSVILPKSEKV